MCVSRSISTLTTFSNAGKKSGPPNPGWPGPHLAPFDVLALAQIRANSFFAGMRRVKAAVPLEGAEVLGAEAARITPRLGRSAGAILRVARARPIGLTGNDRAQDADPEPQAQTAAEAIVTAELNVLHG